MAFDEFYDVFDVVGVGEHVDGAYIDHAVHVVQKRKIARLRGGVAAYVYDAAGGGALYDLDDLFVDAARGGSRITTSGRPLRSTNSSESTSFMSPA